VSDLAAILVGCGIGLVISGTVLWSVRTELKQGWRERRAEPFGEEAETAPSEPPSRPPTSHSGGVRQRRLAIVIGLLVIFGSAFVAIQTNDATIRAVNIVVCVVTALSIGVLFFGPRQR
jgi:hypothetical protein